jgi:shikimate kinase
VSHIVLVGMMGAGKTSIGRRLARRLDRPFVDVDERLEAAAGLSIQEQFDLHGEAAFRAREADELAAVLLSAVPSVVATGGGAVLDARNRGAMRDRATVVWLRAAPDTLLERVGDGAGRPILAGDPHGTLVRLVDQRAAAYAEAAHVTVDVDDLEEDAVLERVVEMLGAGS